MSVWTPDRSWLAQNLPLPSDGELLVVAPAEWSGAVGESGLRVVNLVAVDTAVSTQVSSDYGRFDTVLWEPALENSVEPDDMLPRLVPLLKPAGSLAIGTLLIPGTRRRGKKAERVRAAGRYINAWLRLQNKPYGRLLSLPEWEDTLQHHSLTLAQQITRQRPVDFDTWTAQRPLAPLTRQRLRAMLLQAPAPVADFLTLQIADDRINFHMTEIILIGKKSGNEPGDF